jgi:hypothetical protein
MKMWTFTYDPPDVIEVDCPEGLFPAKDSRGEPIYVNTHFPTRYQALDGLRREVSAGVSHAGSEVKQCEAKLMNAHVRAGHAAVAFKVLQDKFGACWAVCMVDECERECSRGHSVAGYRPLDHWCENHMGGTDVAAT